MLMIRTNLKENAINGNRILSREIEYVFLLFNQTFLYIYIYIYIYIYVCVCVCVCV